MRPVRCSAAPSSAAASRSNEANRSASEPPVSPISRQEQRSGARLLRSSFQDQHRLRRRKSGAASRDRAVAVSPATSTSRRPCPSSGRGEAARPGQPPSDAAFDDGGDQGVLVREVPVDRARGQPGAFADPRDARPLEPALARDLGRRVEDPLPRRLPVRPSPPGRHPGMCPRPSTGSARRSRRRDRHAKDASEEPAGPATCVPYPRAVAVGVRAPHPPHGSARALPSGLRARRGPGRTGSTNR